MLPVGTGTADKCLERSIIHHLCCWAMKTGNRKKATEKSLTNGFF